MSQHEKQLTKKQKIIIYSSAAAAAILAAVVVVIILVHTVTNPPPVILDLSSSAHTSTLSEADTFSQTETLPPADTAPTPLIQGIENGATYYTTQYAFLTDKSIKSVTVNGEDQNLEFFIDGNATNMYVIEITDATDTITTYIVYTKPISTLSEPIGELNEFTVTGDNYNTVKNVRNSVLKLNTNYSPPSESKEIDDIVSLCDMFLSRLDAVSESITELKSTIDKYQEKTPETSDINDIHQTILKIDELLGNTNISSDQLKSLQNMSSKCRLWLSELSPDEPATEIIE